MTTRSPSFQPDRYSSKYVSVLSLGRRYFFRSVIAVRRLQAGTFELVHVLPADTRYSSARMSFNTKQPPGHAIILCSVALNVRWELPKLAKRFDKAEKPASPTAVHCQMCDLVAFRSLMPRICTACEQKPQDCRGAALQQWTGCSLCGNVLLKQANCLAAHVMSVSQAT